jgi:hypothetical protein
MCQAEVANGAGAVSKYSGARKVKLGLFIVSMGMVCGCRGCCGPAETGVREGRAQRELTIEEATTSDGQYSSGIPNDTEQQRCPASRDCPCPRLSVWMEEAGSGPIPVACFGRGEHTGSFPSGMICWPDHLPSLPFAWRTNFPSKALGPGTQRVLPWLSWAILPDCLAFPSAISKAERAVFANGLI